MKLLIVTQVVDKNDSTLGFFHRWIEEFAKHYEEVIVICLYKGVYQLPKNVRVLSLGKEEGVSKLEYLVRFFSSIRKEKKNYDTVFVHMNPEYVVLGGLLWRSWNKRIGLWYVHKSVNLKLRIATLLTHNIFTASKESFRIKTSKVHVLGHGIDTDFFKPDNTVIRGEHLLSVGRLSKSKRHHLVIEAVANIGRELRIAGDGPEREKLEALVKKLGAQVVFLGGLNQESLREEYQKASYLIHTSETGSLDKVVLEALACDTPVITTSEVFKNFPVQKVKENSESIAVAIKKQNDYKNLSNVIREENSLPNLVIRILGYLK